MVKDYLTNLSRLPLVINFVFLFSIFALNFAAQPALKWLYLIYTAFIVASVATLRLSTTIYIIFTFCFLEGQGRILWGYHPFFRIAFDLVMGIAVIRSMIDEGRINTLKILPAPLLAMLLLHFLWYSVQIFNPNSVSIFAPIAATKIYIFPFLVFLMFRNYSDLFTEKRLENLSLLVLLLLLLESVLALYQMQLKENFMLAISPHYLSAMKTDVFTGEGFRPFGTTFLPGAVSIYMFLSTGLLFLRNKFSKKYIATLLLVILAIGTTLFIAQVRSALIKFSLITIGSTLAIIITSNQTKGHRFISIVKFAVAGVFITFSVFYLSPLSKFVDFTPGLQRWSAIDSYEDLKAGRAGPFMALSIAKLRLSERPLGIGPGLTGAASSVSKEAMDNDPIYDRNTFWGFDNLFLSLIVEFGYGAIFYIMLVISIPILLLTRSIKLYKTGQLLNSRITLIAMIQVFVILIGNWGAIGLPYNPESYFFWFWTALGLSTYDNAIEQAGGVVYVPA